LEWTSSLAFSPKFETKKRRDKKRGDKKPKRAIAGCRNPQAISTRSAFNKRAEFPQATAFITDAFPPTTS
jgi:hypothetical protein